MGNGEKILSREAEPVSARRLAGHLQTPEQRKAEELHAHMLYRYLAQDLAPHGHDRKHTLAEVVIVVVVAPVEHALCTCTNGA